MSEKDLFRSMKLYTYYYTYYYYIAYKRGPISFGLIIFPARDTYNL